MFTGYLADGASVLVGQPLGDEFVPQAAGRQDQNYSRQPSADSYLHHAEA